MLVKDGEEGFSTLTHAFPTAKIAWLAANPRPESWRRSLKVDLTAPHTSCMTGSPSTSSTPNLVISVLNELSSRSEVSVKLQRRRLDVPSLSPPLVRPNSSPYVFLLPTHNHATSRSPHCPSHPLPPHSHRFSSSAPLPAHTTLSVVTRHTSSHIQPIPIPTTQIRRRPRFWPRRAWRT